MNARRSNWRHGFCRTLASMAAIMIGSYRTVAAVESPETSNHAIVLELVSFRGMYVDRNNQVRIASTRTPISLEQLVRALLASERDSDELREVVATMRKRMHLLDCEIRGTELGAKRLQNEEIAISREIRLSEQFRRLPP